MKLLVCVLLFCASYLSVVDAGDDYCKALHQSLLFYEANRAGRLPAAQRVTWRGNSALGDCTSPCTTDENGDGNLSGGYYDAGDHVKFGLPMAWTTTVLAWGLLENADAVIACGEQDNYLGTIKWATDYFIKAHISPDELVVQVGNGGSDHAYWGPAETMAMARPVYTINPAQPGTEVAMETAAALAAASIIFKRQGLVDYSTSLLDHARQLFIFGDTYRGIYSDSVPDAANYYKSWSGYNDEIVWAAAWLYRATNDEVYLNRAKSDYTTFQIGNNIVGQSFDWDNKAPGVAALLAQLTSAAPFTDDAQQFLNWWRPAGGVSYTPGGLAWIRQWGPNRYAANAAFIATVVGGTENTEWAKGQIAYMLGSNPLQRSYVCGYGNNYPVNPHHRGAHGSTTNDINNPATNLHVLYGALVGGPDQNDVYADDRLDYIKNEVATDYNAGFTSAVSSLAAYTKAATQARAAEGQPTMSTDNVAVLLK